MSSDGAGVGQRPGESSPATPRRGLLFIVSAPSGAGKTTLVERLVATTPGVKRSRSYTSRPPRSRERDGFDYNFITREHFHLMLAARKFLEWAEICGHLYGTSASDTEQVLGMGDDLVLVIDVQGARKVRQLGIPVIGVFVLPPSFAALEKRLHDRRQDSPSQLRRRLDAARSEVGAFTEYDYVIVNDDLDRSVEDLRAIVLAERVRTAAVRVEAETIVRSLEGGGER